ncbi:MAG TPA: alpha/beta fold hydrolase [Acidimicrobiales bacterium]|nr:alpha/beta fold hydrolase [Acidimicrobiales bacterium]
MRTRRVLAGDVELAILEGLPPAGRAGRPLLLLHGFPAAKEDFAGHLDSLGDLGFHAVAPDQRGHGESDKPGDPSAYSLDILADDALALADALGWRSFTLLGHSMGGMVAQRVAVREQRRPWRTARPSTLRPTGAWSSRTPTTRRTDDAPFLPHAVRMAAAMPAAELVVLPGAGHSPQFENPDAWWRALSDWLTRAR